MPGGQRWAIPESTTVPASTGAKSQATGPEVLLMLPLEGEAALPLPLGKTVNAAINPPTRIRRETTAQLDQTAMYGTPCDLFTNRSAAIGRSSTGRPTAKKEDAHR